MITNSSSFSNNQIIAGLDIGTSKVCILIAKVQNKNLEVIGVSSAHCSGVKKGAVINIDATVEAIKKARMEAELMAGVKISNVYLGVSTHHIESFNSNGMVAIKNREVSADDISRVIETARSVAIKEDRELLHVLPQTFKIDNQSDIRDAIGMSGVRLEVGVHLITGSTMNLLNFAKCAEKAGLNIIGKVLEPLAAAEAVLTQDEKDLGVAVVDMGASSCDIITYINGSVKHTAVVPVGASHITQDVSIGLRTPATNAEEIKRKFGSAMVSLINGQELIDVPSVGGRAPRTVARSMLAEIIEPRADETLNLIHNEIIKSGYRDQLGAGVVLTGGGSSLEGLAELAEFTFEMPVKRGIALNTAGLKEVVNSPEFATVVGLTKFAAQEGKSSAVSKNSHMFNAGEFFEKIKKELSSLF